MPAGAADAGALDRLLSDDADRWLTAAQPELPAANEPLVLVGAGRLGRQTARRLAGRGRGPVAFADDTPALQGGELDGIPVLAIDEAVARLGRTAWFAVTIWSARHRYLDTRERLARAGCERVCSFLDLAWSESAELLPHYAFDLPHATLDHRDEIADVFGLLADETARAQFAAHLRFRLGRDHSALPAPSGASYLDPGLIGSLERVTYVDGGAYDGDTLAAFLRRFPNELEAALLFEPDPQNHERLRDNVARLEPPVRSRVRCFRAALAADDGEGRLAASGTEASAVAPDGDQPIELRRLDSVLAEIANGSTLIKLDVEGGEEAAIRGAEQTIREAAPTIVACLYHRPADLWRIPLLLHEYRPDYQLHIRTEGTDGAGLVCYALPSARTA